MFKTKIYKTIISGEYIGANKMEVIHNTGNSDI